MKYKLSLHIKIIMNIDGKFKYLRGEIGFKRKIIAGFRSMFIKKKLGIQTGVNLSDETVQYAVYSSYQVSEAPNVPRHKYYST